MLLTKSFKLRVANSEHAFGPIDILDSKVQCLTEAQTVVSTVLNEARHIRRANASKIHDSLLEPLAEISMGESYVVGRRALRQLPFL
jgi:hypothetical protein